MINQITEWVIGGGILSFVSVLITIKYTKKAAEADAMKKMQDVYQEMIDDLRKDKAESRGEMAGLRQEMNKLSEEVQESKTIANENKRLYIELKPFKCIDLSCIKRKS
ncbi:MAG: hypothetical protein ACRC3Z_11140 [Phocaeicola sp.]